MNKPAWSLAAVEAISRKSTVGSGVLSSTAAAMCIVVYAVATGMAGTISTIPYDCDVVMDTIKANKYYSYVDHLESVEGTESLYFSMQEFKLNDEKKSTIGYFYALPDDGFTYFQGFDDVPESIDEGNVVIDKKYASRKGLSEGDVMTLTINPNGAFPIEREYKIQKIIEGNPYDQGVDAVLIRENEYKAMFRDLPGQILIKCGDAETVKQSIETYGKGTYSQVKTLDEIVEEQESGNSKTVAVITAIIVIALGMTAVGMISNQLIGFEGRKKECAVLLSTAMNKRKLSGILLKEVLITSVTASVVGTLVGSVLTMVIKAALDNAETIVVDLTIDPVKTLLFFFILTAVFTATVLFPIKNLRKMKISEQIKYE